MSPWGVDCFVSFVSFMEEFGVKDYTAISGRMIRRDGTEMLSDPFNMARRGWSTRTPGSHFP